jgi:hypothetical protein
MNSIADCRPSSRATASTVGWIAGTALDRVARRSPSAGVHLPDSTVTTAEGAKFFSVGSAFRAGIAGLELARG